MVNFISWLRTWAAFHIFGKFKNYSAEQVDYLEEHFKPKTQRDKNLKHEIIMYNRARLCQF